MRLRVLLADDNPGFLRAASDALSFSSGIEVVGLAPDGQVALGLARTLVPDVAVIDVEMPGGGQELARSLTTSVPGVRVMCLSGRDDERTVLDMLAAGANGYVVKGALDEDLATCVARCASGALFVIASCADQVRARIAALVLG